MVDIGEASDRGGARPGPSHGGARPSATSHAQGAGVLRGRMAGRGGDLLCRSQRRGACAARDGGGRASECGTAIDATLRPDRRRCSILGDAGGQAHARGSAPTAVTRRTFGCGWPARHDRRGRDRPPAARGLLALAVRTGGRRRCAHREAPATGQRGLPRAARRPCPAHVRVLRSMTMTRRRRPAPYALHADGTCARRRQGQPLEHLLCSPTAAEDCMRCSRNR